MFTLVENGKSDYVIVVGDKASESEKFAAEELQSHIEKMSGAKLPIVNQAPAPNAKAILLGQDLYPVKDAPDWRTLGDDGFVLSVLDNGTVVIAGGRRRGTLYGAYTLLEKLGVRWWTPTETYIPQMKTIRIAPFSLTQKPILEYRDMLYQEIFSEEGRLWCARNKVNGMGWSKTPGETRRAVRVRRQPRPLLHGPAGQERHGDQAGDARPGQRQADQGPALPDQPGHGEGHDGRRRQGVQGEPRREVRRRRPEGQPQLLPRATRARPWRTERSRPPAP